MSELSKFYRDKQVFVTGADGFIGSHLTETLLECGAFVTALAQYNSFGNLGWLDDLPAEITDKLSIVSGDIRDAGFLSSVIEGSEIVFHLAALIAIPHSYVSPQSYVDVNVSGTLHVLECCRKMGVKRLVHTSTSEVYGTALFKPISEEHPLQAQSPYAASKIAADKLVESYHRSYDLKVITLRPFNTFGPRQSERAVIPTIIRQVLDRQSETVLIGSLITTRDFNYVLDTVKAFLLAGSSDNLTLGGTYNAGTGVACKIADIIDTVFDVTKQEKEIVVDQSRVRPENSEVMDLIADSSLFSDLSGWKPDYDLRLGLEKTIDWWNKKMLSGNYRKSTDYLT